MKGWVGLVGWPVADGLPTLVVTIRCRSSAGQGKFASQRPTFYYCATSPRHTVTQTKQVSGIYGAWCRVSGACRSISVSETSWLHSWCQYGVWGLDDIDHPMIVNAQKQNDSWFAFSTLMLLVGRQEGIRPVKNWMVGCWHCYLSAAKCRLAYGPADATATHCLLLQ